MEWVDLEEHGVRLRFGLLEAWLPDDAVGGEFIDRDTSLDVEELLVGIDYALMGKDVKRLVIKGTLVDESLHLGADFIGVFLLEIKKAVVGFECIYFDLIHITSCVIIKFLLYSGY